MRSSRLSIPRSVAIIGASADANKTAGRPVSYLHKHGFAGEIAGQSACRQHRRPALLCRHRIAAGSARRGIVLLGAERAHVAVRELAARGTAAAIVLASGYSETGEAGAHASSELMAAAGTCACSAPIRLAWSISPTTSSCRQPAPWKWILPAGSIGVVSQSGGILGALLSRAAARGIGLSKLVSTSNEVDLDLSDLSITWPMTTPPGSSHSMSKAPQSGHLPGRGAEGGRAGKPVVAFKIGRSEAGAQAAVSHTGALAGADRMYDALFRQVGSSVRRPSAICSTYRPRWQPAACCAATGSRSSPRRAAPERWWPTTSAWRASRRRRRTRRPRGACARCRPATMRR